MKALNEKSKAAAVLSKAVAQSAPADVAAVNRNSFKYKWQHNKKIYLQSAVKYFVRIIFLITAMFPFYWSIVTALKPTETILNDFNLIPRVISFEHFKTALKVTGLGEALFNTLSTTALSMVLNISVSLLAGYAFARIDFAGKKIVFKILLMSMMLPFAVVFIPTFIVLTFLKLTTENSVIFGIILPGAVSVYNIFFLRQFFLTLPNDLGESARIDGANEFTIFYKIYLPLITPAVATLAVFTFQSGWNNYFWPYIISGGSFKLLTTVLRSFYLGSVADYGGGMAFTLLVTLPMLIIFIFFQKYFMRGIVSSGMKE